MTPGNKRTVQAGRSIASFNMVDNVGLVKKVAFKQKLEEGSGSAIAWTGKLWHMRQQNSTFLEIIKSISKLQVSVSPTFK